MLQRNPHRPNHVGIIAVSVVAGAAAISAVVAVAPGTADDGPSRSAPPAPLVEAARGSDVHLENLAADIAQRRTAALVQAARGSDVHLENIAADIAQRRTAALVEAARGSDVHLGNIAADIAQRRVSKDVRK